MNDKLREIRETLNTYHASKIGSERYAAKYEIVDNAIDVADTLSAEIDRLTGELEQKTLALGMALTKISELEHPNYHDTQTLTIKSPQGKDGE